MKRNAGRTFTSVKKLFNKENYEMRPTDGQKKIAFLKAFLFILQFDLDESS